jgi:hypothetical protein
MPKWFDNAVEGLERDLEEGAISQEEFKTLMRELQKELREGAEEAAEQARQNYYDDW